MLVTGRVQGVYYRAFTQEIALQHGLSGWVRNLSDGRVEAVFEGKKDAIEQAINQCHTGPRGALVEAVRVDWERYQGDLGDFQIRYY